MKKVLVFFCVVLLIQLSCSGSSEKKVGEPGKPIEILTREDTVEIVKQSLEIGVIGRRELDVNNPKDVVFWTEVNPELIPQLPGINLILMTPEEMQEKANREGHFESVELHHPWMVSNTVVGVSVRRTCYIPEDSNELPLGGGVRYLEFKKINGTWVGETIRNLVI